MRLYFFGTTITVVLILWVLSLRWKPLAMWLSRLPNAIMKKPFFGFSATKTVHSGRSVVMWAMAHSVITALMLPRCSGPKRGSFPRMVKFVVTRQYDLHFVTTHTQLVVWLYECFYYFIFLVKVFPDLDHAWEVLRLRFPAGIYYASTHWYIVMLNIHLSTIATTWKISVCLASIMYLVQTVVANENILSSLFTEP